MDKFVFLVVLYNKRIDESETLNSLINCVKIKTNCDLILWDNSPIKMDDLNIRDYSKKVEPFVISYKWDGINHYLSKIYNSIITDCEKDATLIILDHDSELPSDFLMKIEETINKEENKHINLFLPTIYSHGKIISPAYETIFKHKMWKERKVGVIDAKKLTAINSGMVIRCSYLKNDFPGYNERLKFYETDNDFMRKYRKQNDYVYVLDVSISHSLNFIEDDLASKVIRFKAMKEGRYIVSKEMGLISFTIEKVRFIYLSIKYCVFYKTFSFLK